MAVNGISGGNPLWFPPPGLRQGAPSPPTNPPPGLTPATLPVSQFPDRTPYVLVAYHPYEPNPPTAEPAPIGREVPPVQPVAASRPIGRALLRQVQFRGGRGERSVRTEYGIAAITTSQAEKAIRHTLTMVNADLTTQELPLHLVLSQGPDGLGVDVYDCSYYEVCRLSYHVPLPLGNLTGALDKLQHATGLVIDEKW